MRISFQNFDIEETSRWSINKEKKKKEREINFAKKQGVTTRFIERNKLHLTYNARLWNIDSIKVVDQWMEGGH